jgi:hypothetical protein
MGNAGRVNEGMASMTRVTLPGLLSVYDFSGIGTLMDDRRGLGELMIAILKKYPSMRDTVFDLSHCAQGARKNLAGAGHADRCQSRWRKLFRIGAFRRQRDRYEERHPRRER